ncbi:MAG: hypothetical protein ABW022_11470 [Actinoplanes sp.]
MTVAAHNNHPHVTDGEHVRVGVRASETARVLPIRPGLEDSSAGPRAIPRSPHVIKGDKPSKIRDFASQHAGEARESLASSWLGQGRPQNLTQVARQVKTGNPVAVFRLAVYSLAYLMCFAIDTNKRAAVTAALLALSLLTAWAISALAS